MVKAFQSQQSKLDYSPLHLYIEPTNNCQLRCSHCIQDKMTRPRGKISIKLYEKIVNECAEIGIPWVYLFLHGEPTLHPRLADLIELTHEAGIEIRLHTNGLVDLTRYPPVEKLHISLNEGKDLHKIKNNLQRLRRDELPYTIDEIDGCSPDLEEQQYHKSLYNWHQPGKNMQGRCSQPYKTMAVLWDGRVVPCCVDYKPELVIGEVGKMSLLDIWNSKEMLTVREGKFSLCSTCDMKRGL